MSYGEGSEHNQPLDARGCGADHTGCCSIENGCPGRRSRNNASLEELAEEFTRTCMQGEELVSSSFREKDLLDVIRLAASGFWEHPILGNKKHPHQWRIVNRTAEEAGEALVELAYEIENADTFERLLAIVRRVQRPTENTGLGDLWSYDTAQRIWQRTGGGVAIDRVYLHCGVIDGFNAVCRRANVTIERHRDMSGARYANCRDFPEPLNRFPGEHLESFLCTFKDRI